MKNDIAQGALMHQLHTKHASIPVVILNIADICNRRCSFCPRSNGYYSPHDNPFMMPSVIKKVCEDLTSEYTGLFSISGFGEPTMHLCLREMICICQQMCPLASVRVITNGDFIEQLKGIDGIRIDLSMYEHLSIERLEKLRDMFGDMLHVKDIFNSSIQCFNNRAGNAAFDADLAKVQHNCCNIPFYKIAVDVNGDVYQCCSDWKRECIMGNVMQESILNIWHNDKYEKLRKSLVHGKRHECKLCARCSADGLLAGNEFMEEWKKGAQCQLTE